MRALRRRDPAVGAAVPTPCSAPTATGAATPQGAAQLLRGRPPPRRRRRADRARRAERRGQGDRALRHRHRRGGTMAALTEVTVPESGTSPTCRSSRSSSRSATRSGRGPARRARVGQGDDGGALARRRAVVKELLVKVGDTVAMGSKLLMLEGEEGAAEVQDDAASLRGCRCRARSRRQPPPRRRTRPRKPARSRRRPTATASAARLRIAVRAPRCARAGVDLTSITGSGRKGRITKDDVAEAGTKRLATARRKHELAAGVLPRRGRARGAHADPASSAATTSHARGRRSRTSPTTTRPTSPTLEAFRKQLNAEQSDVKVTMVALLLKAVQRDAARVPADELVAGRRRGRHQRHPQPRVRGRHAQRAGRAGHPATSTARASCSSPPS